MTSEFARNRLKNAACSGALLWSMLRGRQVCGLRFRREHPIEPWIVEYACVSNRIVVEVDGGYREETAPHDLRRQRDLESKGWKVIRFTDEEVEQNGEAVSRAIAAKLGIEYSFERRAITGSGKRSVRAKKPNPK